MSSSDIVADMARQSKSGREGRLSWKKEGEWRLASLTTQGPSHREASDKSGIEGISNPKSNTGCAVEQNVSSATDPYYMFVGRPKRVGIGWVMNLATDAARARSTQLRIFSFYGRDQFTL